MAWRRLSVLIAFLLLLRSGAERLPITIYSITKGSPPASLLTRAAF